MPAMTSSPIEDDFSHILYSRLIKRYSATFSTLATAYGADALHFLAAARYYCFVDASSPSLMMTIFFQILTMRQTARDEYCSVEESCNSYLIRSQLRRHANAPLLYRIQCAPHARHGRTWRTLMATSSGPSRSHVPNFTFTYVD